MKKQIIYLIGLVVLISACQKYETEAPELTKFGIYEIVDDGGEQVAGNELSTIPVGETVRMQALTNADIAIIWTGDYSYRPWGETDSVLDSHSWEHYGQVGAEGWTTGALEGGTGFFRDYSWDDAGSYTVTLILTVHGTAGMDYKQEIFEFPITVQ